MAADADAPECGTSEGGWSPDADACWRPVDWPAPCGLQVAVQPRRAVPPMQWEECSWGQPGCRRLRVLWPPPLYSPVISLSLARRADGYWTGMTLSWVDGTERTRRSGVWAPDGRPVAAWTGPSNASENQYCDPEKPQLGQSRVWLGASWIADGTVTQTYVSAPYGELETASEAIDYHGANQDIRGADDTLALAAMDGVHATVYDRIAGIASTFGGAQSWQYDAPFPVGDSAVGSCWAGDDATKACIWNRATHAMEPLVAPASDHVSAIGTDGQILVWVRCPATAPSTWDWTACRLWTSNFATQAAELEPVARCATVGQFWRHSVVGGGMAAMWTADHTIVVYRLSDGRMWELPPTEDQSAPGPSELAYIDEQELWYRDIRGVVRQELAPLGPGTPCPAP